MLHFPKQPGPLSVSFSAQPLGDWDEKQRVIGSSPGGDKIQVCSGLGNVQSTAKAPPKCSHRALL